MNVNNEFLNACLNGEFEHVKKLLSKIFFKPDVNVKVISSLHEGKTALHIVSDKGFKNIAELLIKKGADINTKDNKGYTPLFRAIISEKLELMELLINHGADINATNNGGKTVLHHATMKGKKDLAMFLIKMGADLNLKYLILGGYTPLHLAIEGHKYEIAIMLIENGCDVNIKNDKGNTPLHFAAYSGQRSIAELLLRKGADVNATNNNRKKASDCVGANDVLDMKFPFRQFLELKETELTYFEVLCPTGDGICSDRSCPCSNTIIPRGSGYLYISKEVVDFRSNAKTLFEVNVKLSTYKVVGGKVDNPAAPVLMCEVAAIGRKLDLKVAAEDARYWWETGLAPLRPTPMID
jgi:hypothetical protein